MIGENFAGGAPEPIRKAEMTAKNERITKDYFWQTFSAQSSKVLKQLYELKKVMESHPHDEQREEGIRWLMELHEGFQRLSQWIMER